MTDGNFRRFLARSLETLRSELPVGYAAVAAGLGRREVRVQVDGEELAICSDGRQLTLVDAALYPVAYAQATTAALRSILEGEESLENAVLAQRIHLQGCLDDLVAFYEALRSYFNAAVRCPSFAGLLREYLLATRNSHHRK